MHQLRGTGVALVTPFKGGTIDVEALGNIVDRVLDNGVDYIVSLGTTGEASTLDPAEQTDIIERTKQYIKGRVPLVAGSFGGNDTKALISKINASSFDGISAILSASPAYNKPTQEGIIAHYTAIADISPVPIVLYNVPSRTSSNLIAETTLILAEHENIIGIKEASGNMLQSSTIIRHKPEDFVVLSGDDPTALPLISCGGDGVISVIANALPGLFSDMVRSALNGDFHSAGKLHLKCIDIHPLLYKEGNPAGIKGALEILGLCTREVRLPLLPLSEKNYGLLRDLLKAL